MYYYLITVLIFTILPHFSTQQKQHDRRIAQIIRSSNPYQYIVAAPPNSGPTPSNIRAGPPIAPPTEWQSQVPPTVVYQQSAPDLSMVLKVAETLNSYHEKVRASNTLNPEDIINKLINALIITSANTSAGGGPHKTTDVADVALLQVSSCVEPEDCEIIDFSSLNV